ncbi:hypothetical protein TcWFU_001444 [Taenia crassiceps]|uniref:Uncharacterized protein n=1 Tax=Taenia crassiceps TaxID=6207 RepID=A0ABR4QFT8_9CEST
MRLRDLKFLKTEPSIDPENTRNPAESSEAPEGFENPEDTQQHIELNLFIPKEGEVSNPILLEPTDITLESGNSSSSTTSSSDASDTEELSNNKRLLSPEEPQPSKRPKIEEIDGTPNTDDKEDTTSSSI